MATEDTHSGSDVWHDLMHGYVPTDELDIHPSLTFHDADDVDIDPITYEVIRHRLWTINLDHGRTIENVSGSPVAYYAGDFNPTILAEDGEIVVNGPYVQVFSPFAELTVKWTLENRSDNPGIEPGDMFLSNDPWVGANHQPDLLLFAPMFVDGELFCWVQNTLHQYDLGGTNPGSIDPNAEDVYNEPVPIPPIKIVENGEVRKDLRQMYLRHSRMPQMVGLDFNAQVAGMRLANEQIRNLIEKYGKDTVKRAMKKMIEDSETAFLERMRDVPDGTWRARSYEVDSTAEDGGLLRFGIQLEKEGDTLTFSNEGTDGNAGIHNITYGAFRTCISGVLNPLMLYDQKWLTSGAYRHIEIDTEPGTLNHATYPSSVCVGGSSQIDHTFGLMYDVVVRMLAASETSRDDMMLGYHSGTDFMSLAGLDQWGDPYGVINLDLMGTGFSARSSQDGIDVGGRPIAPKGKIPNMEENEQSFPILYLSREEATDSGGIGMYRGGAGLQTLYVPHKTDAIQSGRLGSGCLGGIGRGLASYPGKTITSEMTTGSDVSDRLEAGTIPTKIEEIDGEHEVLSPIGDWVQGPDDVLKWQNGGGMGYGDPLERDPALVEVDVRKGVVSEESAFQHYGVVLTDRDDDVVVNEEATEARRGEIREARRSESSTPDGPDRTSVGSDEDRTQIHPYLDLDTEHSQLVCRQCDHPLCDAEDNYKERVAERRRPISDEELLYDAPSDVVGFDPGFEFREYFCPNCAVLYDHDVALESDPVLHDIDIDTASR